MLSSGWPLIALAAAAVLLVLWLVRRSVGEYGDQEHASVDADGKPEQDRHHHGGHGCC